MCLRNKRSGFTVDSIIFDRVCFITMKVTKSFAFLLLSYFSSGVISEDVIRVLFNNGVVNNNLICNSTDWTKINPIFENVNTTHRNLRQVQTMSNELAIDFELNVFGVDNKERKLPTAAQCKNLCAGQTPGTYCRASGCSWYIVRRKLGNWCSEATNMINRELNNLITLKRVSNSCQLLLKAPRKFECLDDIMFGEVEQFNVWNAATDKILEEKARDGYTVCKSIPINIQVQTNPCVDVLYIELKGSHDFNVSRTSSEIPYTIFGNSGADMLSRPLAAGDYRITAIPDNDIEKEARFEFTVLNC